ncbi:MAG: hypothetical protein ACTSX9_03725 [Candidatus Njordarchaeales archaeon]
MTSTDWISIYYQLIKFLDKHDPKRTFELRGELGKRFEHLRDELRRRFVRNQVGDELETAIIWVKILKKTFEDAEKLLRMKGELLPKELKSFLDNPEHHLMKKVIFYLYDLLRNKIEPEDFLKTAGAAVRTSLKTNMRSIYQTWVYVTVLKLLGEKGGRIVYPELKYLLIGRSGRQKTGWIPPNAVIQFIEKGYLSFFIEAPRPIGWEDSTDLRKIWTLYTALRPDFLVYEGRVLNIVKLDSNPPIMKPNIIIECKELEDWYKRGREVRGPFAKPLSVEEWRSKWITGLWDGLSDILGVKRTEVVEEVKKKKALRLKDVQIVTLYHTLYKPDKMFLVSRSLVPSDIKTYLEDRGIIVYDNIGFEERKLRELADELYKHAKRGGSDRELIEIPTEIIDTLNHLLELLGSKGRNYSRIDVLRAALRLAIKKVDEVLDELEKPQ